MPGLLVLIALGVTVTLFACGGGGGGDAATPPAAAPPAPPPSPPPGLFPLRVDSGGRYLVDASGNPFLLHVDSAWSLIADLSEEDAKIYLEDRRQKGFNAIIVNLLERQYSSNANAMPKYSNFYGQPPFTTTDDYGTPNPDYFAHADYVIQLAASKGILVLLAPSYLGYGGGADGWFVTMQSNAGKLRDYGRFLGQRYAAYKNILWLHGGDFEPPAPDRQLVANIALGIKEFDSVSLHSAHCAPYRSALDCWAGETWLQVNNIYMYDDVPLHARLAYANPMPFFLLESRYENEPPDGNEQHIRVQAYQALLSGAMGQAFGNHPIWHFDGPGVYATPAPPNWEAWLDSPGAMSMVHVRELLFSRAWWTLVPDLTSAFLTNGLGSGQFDLAVAAKAGDGSFGLIYMPNARTVTVSLGQLAGPNVNARWFDPADGAYTSIGVFPNSGPQAFTTPGPNASTSYSDWVLVLESTL